MSQPMNDPIADMLTRIRNGLATNAEVIEMPSSNFKLSIAKLLKSAGYLNDVKVVKKDFAVLVIELKDAERPITMLRRLSTPGRRLYAQSDRLTRSKRPTGLVIVSTPQGIMTSGQAAKRHLGGEIVCEVY